MTDTTGPLRMRPARPEEADALAAIRVAAMQPSLEAIGRFDPERARNRFLNGFVPADTQTILAGDTLVGFSVVRRLEDCLYLDHLYVAEAAQGAGVGRWVLDRLKTEARSLGLPIRLRALEGSPANRFYRSNGFRFVRAEDVDRLYEWKPTHADRESDPG